MIVLFDSFSFSHFLSSLLLFFSSSFSSVALCFYFYFYFYFFCASYGIETIIMYIKAARERWGYEQ